MKATKRSGRKPPQDDFYLVPRPELSFARSIYRFPPLPTKFTHDPDLAAYAFQCLHMDFTMDGVANYVLCPECSEAYRRLSIKQQKSEEDFFGIVTGKCAYCKKSTELLSRVLESGEHMKSRKLKCACRGRSGFRFIHARSSTGGFFEEEVIVGRCLDCGERRLILKGD